MPSELVIKIIGVIGFASALLSVAFQEILPWVTFQQEYLLINPATKVWEWVYFEISPFLIRYQFESGVARIEWFYKMDSTLIGAMCLAGTAVGLIGVLKKSRIMNLIGGTLVFASLPAFGTSLPGIYPYIAWSSGAKMAIFGSIMLLASASIGYVKDHREKERLSLKNLKEAWESDQSACSDKSFK